MLFLNNKGLVLKFKFDLTPTFQLFVYQFYILYINDMHRSSTQMRFVHFVDDTITVFASDSDINNVHATVNRELVGVDN